MIYDRPYMSTSFDQRFKNALIWLIGANVAVFALQHIFRGLFGTNFIIDAFVLSLDSVWQGKIWTLFTYSFLHSESVPLHLIGNMLGVFFLGRALLPELGAKRFMQLYFGSVLIGGLLWLFSTTLSQIGASGPAAFASPKVLGASGAVFGLLTMFACLYPNREIQVLLMFIIPVRVKPKTLAFIALGFSVFAFLFYELLGNSTTAHSAHLGGMLGGWLFFRYVHRPGYSRPAEGISIKMPSWFKRKKASKSAESSYNYKVNISQKPADLKAEVDRILDKINSQGFGSLSPREKEILDQAGDLLKRR